MFCSRCGVANKDDARFCKACAAALNGASGQVARPARSPGLAAVLSFFICGLGQIYNGQIIKGLLMMAAFTISWFLIFVVIGLFTTPILWIIGIFDAYWTANRLNMMATQRSILG